MHIPNTKQTKQKQNLKIIFLGGRWPFAEDPSCFFPYFHTVKKGVRERVFSNAQRLFRWPLTVGRWPFSNSTSTFTHSHTPTLPILSLYPFSYLRKINNAMPTISYRGLEMLASLIRILLPYAEA